MANHSVRLVKQDDYKAVYVMPQHDDLIGSVSLAYYGPGHTMPMHSHSVGQFSTLISGSAYEANLNSEYENCHGIAEFKPIHYRHSNRIGPDGALYVSINIHAEQDAFVDEFGHLDWRLCATRGTGHHWQSLAMQLFQYQQHLHQDFETQVMALLSSAIPYSGKVKVPPAWLKLAEQALYCPHLSIEQIAQDVGVHRVHLCRVFQAHFGLSVSAFRQRIALQKALSALIMSNHTISAASYTSGYADQSHLTRVMKKQFGVTPAKVKSLFRG